MARSASLVKVCVTDIWLVFDANSHDVEFSWGTERAKIPAHNRHRNRMCERFFEIIGAASEEMRFCHVNGMAFVSIRHKMVRRDGYTMVEIWRALFSVFCRKWFPWISMFPLRSRKHLQCIDLFVSEWVRCSFSLSLYLFHCFFVSLSLVYWSHSQIFILVCIGLVRTRIIQIVLPKKSVENGTTDCRCLSRSTNLSSSEERLIGFVCMCMLYHGWKWLSGAKVAVFVTGSVKFADGLLWYYTYAMPT